MISTLDDRLNRVVEKLTNDDFLRGRGLGNEIGFYIFDYPPDRELEVRERLQHILFSCCWTLRIAGTSGW